MARHNYTPEEWNEIGRKAAELAQQEARDLGLPFSYMIGDKIIQEYPDGRKMEVQRNGDGTFTETPYSGE
ncbi:hypothetical protein ACFQ3J_20975 [Paenibacillus provencensis]|uniref:Uncharacterized protein n=1 Tax=Paenibacillus provencensis TaxID=441151 RepID=A0ABW3Q9C1_9BACL